MDLSKHSLLQSSSPYAELKTVRNHYRDMRNECITGIRRCAEDIKFGQIILVFMITVIIVSIVLMIALSHIMLIVPIASAGAACVGIGLCLRTLQNIRDARYNMIKCLDASIKIIEEDMERRGI